MHCLDYGNQSSKLLIVMMMMAIMIIVRIIIIMMMTLSGTSLVFFLMKVRSGQLMQRTARHRKKPILNIFFY